MFVPEVFEIVDNCLDCKLQRSHFFCSFSRDVLRVFQRIKYTATYPKDATLFSEGQASRGLFVLCQGRVRLSATSSQGKIMTFKFAQPGDVLGLSANVSGRPYEMTAETVEACQLDFVKRDDFLGLVNNHNEVAVRVARHLSLEYEAAWREFRTLNFSRSANERLAGLLLRWSSGSATFERVPNAIRLTATHEEIAQMIGTSRETVTRLLAKMKRQQVLQARGSVVVIQDVAELSRMAGSCADA